MLLRRLIGLSAALFLATSCLAAEPLEIKIGYLHGDPLEDPHFADGRSRRERRPRRRAIGDRRQQHHRPLRQPALHADRKDAARRRRRRRGGRRARRRRRRHSRSATSTPTACSKAADAAKARGLVVLNAGATDDRLREEDCRANVVHVAPTRIDARRRARAISDLEEMAQMAAGRRLARSRTSSSPTRCAAPRALRREDRRGARIQGHRRRAPHRQRHCRDPAPDAGADARARPTTTCWSPPTRARFSPAICPIAPGIRDRSRARPGLVPTTWDAAFDQWGAVQLQNRFVQRVPPLHDAAGHAGLERGPHGRRSGRAHQLARTRRGCSRIIKGPDFSLAAFKGQKLTLRDWNLQLRQPILLFDGRNTVSVSPQEGYLHQFSELDTLGVDRPETNANCKLPDARRGESP